MRSWFRELINRRHKLIKPPNSVGFSHLSTVISIRCSAKMVSFIERQINVFLWFAWISVTVFLLGKLLKIFAFWAKARQLPGPRCPSFYGHYSLISRSNLTDVLCRCHKRYGKVMKLWLGPTQLLVSIADTELIKEVLLKAEDKYPLTGRAFHAAFGRSSLFISPFNEVGHRRKSLEVELGGAMLQRTNLIPIEKIVNWAVGDVQNVMVKGGVDSETVSRHLAFSILGATLFGDMFLAWPMAILYEELLMKIADHACFWSSYGVTPFWKHGFWKYHRSCNELKSLTLELIEYCKQNNKFGVFLDFGNHNDTRYESCAEIISLMFHGTQTMAALIDNILSSLVTYPEIQSKIYSEIDLAKNVMQKSNEKKINIDGLPHLLATVYESARLLPAGPLLQRCSLKHDLSLKSGLVIPAGAILVMPVQLVQIENSNWGNEADKFNPYRFLSRIDDGYSSDNEESLAGRSCIVKDPNEFEAFFHFGFGARACLGQKLAIHGISSLFSALLEHYEISFQQESESEPTAKNNSILQHHPTPKITFTKRSC